MYTQLLIGLNYKYGPCAWSGHWTLISVPKQNIVVKKLKSDAQNKLKQKGMV